MDKSVYGGVSNCCPVTLSFLIVMVDHVFLVCFGFICSQWAEFTFIETNMCTDSDLHHENISKNHIVWAWETCATPQQWLIHTPQRLKLLTIIHHLLMYWENTPSSSFLCFHLLFSIQPSIHPTSLPSLNAFNLIYIHSSSCSSQTRSRTVRLHHNLETHKEHEVTFLCLWNCVV